MKKFALVALLALFACTTDASAAFKVKVTVNGTDKLIEDGINPITNDGDLTGDASASGGIYTIFVNLGNLGFSGLTGFLTVTSNRPGDPDANIGAEISVSLQGFRNTNAAVRNIVITSTDTGFTIPGGLPGTLANDPAASFDPSTGTTPLSNVSVSSFIGLGNAEFDTTFPNPSLTSAITSSQPTTVSQIVSLPSTYSLTNTLSLTIPGNSTTFTGNLGGTTSVTAVPVPPAVALLASGALPLAGFFFLRRRKQA